MKFQIRWTEDDRPQVRRADKVPMTDADRAEARELLEKMLKHQVCWNCGWEWSEFTRTDGKKFKVCWACAKST